MIILRPSNTRGYADHGWLKSFHSFSFASYYDRNHMGFGNLRVINEDFIQAGGGFGTHPHQDMEIITYVLSGHLFHKDSMGNHATIAPGEVQRMTAGSGITHSEHSHPTTETHLLQIWLKPNQLGLSPSYEQIHFSSADKQGTLLLVASHTGEQGSVKLNADAQIYATLLNQTDFTVLNLNPARKYYVFLIKGNLTVNDTYILNAGDAALISHETRLTLTKANTAEALIFDLSA
jgi:quercetin 2,3-dioxygenase